MLSEDPGRGIFKALLEPETAVPVRRAAEFSVPAREGADVLVRVCEAKRVIEVKKPAPRIQKGKANGKMTPKSSNASDAEVDGAEASRIAKVEDNSDDDDDDDDDADDDNVNDIDDDNADGRAEAEEDEEEPVIRIGDPRRKSKIVEAGREQRQRQQSEGVDPDGRQRNGEEDDGEGRPGRKGP